MAYSASVARSPIPAVLALALACAACGSDDTTPAGSASATTTTAGAGTSTSGPGAGTGGAGHGGAGGQGSSSGGAGAAPVACTSAKGAPGDADLTVMSSGTERKYHLHAPPGYVPDQATMLVLVFHGFTEGAAQIETITHMTETSDAHGFLVAYPEGSNNGSQLDNGWNAGKCCGSSVEAVNDIPDVQFVKDMLDQIEAAYCVDTKRVFSAGFSNGGMLSHRLGCELSDRIAAIGPVSGTISVDTCEPTRAVAVAAFHGTSDFVVPYDGGGFGNATSEKATIDGWIERDGCPTTATNVYAMGDASCDEYGPCKDGTAVRLCTIDGGGHQWPGGSSAGPAGKISMDISASEALYEFFSKHPM